MDFREDLREEEMGVLERYGRRLTSLAGEGLSFDPYHEALFVMSGGLQARAIDARGKTVVRMYASGEVLNELSVVTARISLLSVTASVPSVSLVVSQDSVDSLVTEHPKVAAKLFRHFAKLVIYRTVPHRYNSPSFHPALHAHDSLSQAS
jgi:CRP-like cAMP-binding protein